VATRAVAAGDEGGNGWVHADGVVFQLPVGSCVCVVLWCAGCGEDVTVVQGMQRCWWTELLYVVLPDMANDRVNFHSDEVCLLLGAG
jgi:hypothetical protein